jgi:hypothetical protein
MSFAMSLQRHDRHAARAAVRERGAAMVATPLFRHYPAGCPIGVEGAKTLGLIALKADRVGACFGLGRWVGGVKGSWLGYGRDGLDTGHERMREYDRDFGASPSRLDPRLGMARGGEPKPSRRSFGPPSRHVASP